MGIVNIIIVMVVIKLKFKIICQSRCKFKCVASVTEQLKMSVFQKQLLCRVQNTCILEFNEKLE